MGCRLLHSPFDSSSFLLLLLFFPVLLLVLVLHQLHLLLLAVLPLLLPLLLVLLALPDLSVLLLLLLCRRLDRGPSLALLRNGLRRRPRPGTEVEVVLVLLPGLQKREQHE